MPTDANYVLRCRLENLVQNNEDMIDDQRLPPDALAVLAPTKAVPR